MISFIFIHVYISHVCVYIYIYIYIYVIHDWYPGTSSPRLTPEEVLRVGGTLKEASSVAELAAEGRRDEDPARSTEGPACSRV